MRSKEKFGSSLATVKAKSFEITVVSHLGLPSEPSGTAEIPLSADGGRFLRLPEGVLVPIRNFDIRSFWVVCLFGRGVLVWLGNFCRLACERTLRRVSSLRAMVLIEVMN